jgi:hypothetical protein
MPEFDLLPTHAQGCALGFHEGLSGLFGEIFDIHHNFPEGKDYAKGKKYVRLCRVSSWNPVPVTIERDNSNTRHHLGGFTHRTKDFQKTPPGKIPPGAWWIPADMPH